MHWQHQFRLFCCLNLHKVIYWQVCSTNHRIFVIEQKPLISKIVFQRIYLIHIYHRCTFCLYTFWLWFGIGELCGSVCVRINLPNWHEWKQIISDTFDAGNLMCSVRSAIANYYIVINLSIKCDFMGLPMIHERIMEKWHIDMFGICGLFGGMHTKKAHRQHPTNNNDDTVTSSAINRQLFKERGRDGGDEKSAKQPAKACYFISQVSNRSAYTSIFHFTLATYVWILLKRLMLDSQSWHINFVSKCMKCLCGA